MNHRLRRAMLLIMVVVMVLAACQNDENASDQEDDQNTNENTAPGEGDLLGVLTDPRQPIESFGGPSTKGGDFQLEDYRGKVVLLYFGFTSCPDICPTTLAEMRQVMADFADDAANIQFVMVTIDPERDTLDKLRTYVETFDTRFIGVRQEGATLQAMQDQFGVTAVRQELPDSALGYTFDHTPSVFVIDTAGQWVERFLYGTSRSTIMRDVRMLLAERDTTYRARASDLSGVVSEPRQRVEDFGGPSTQGGDIRIEDYRGKVVLLYFGFTACPDVCPTTLAEMRQVMTALGDDATNVQFVMVTVDPERDTIDKLKAYVETFDADFVGIRQEGEALQALQDQFEVKAFRRDLPDSALGYTIDHTANIYVIDKQGRRVEQFTFGTPVETIERDVRLLIGET